MGRCTVAGAVSVTRDRLATYLCGCGHLGQLFHAAVELRQLLSNLLLGRLGLRQLDCERCVRGGLFLAFLPQPLDLWRGQRRSVAVVFVVGCCSI